MRRLYYLLPLFVLLLLLTGCVEEGEAKEVKEDLSAYPTSVQEGVVSPEFYDEIKTHEKANDKFIANTSSYPDILDVTITKELQEKVNAHLGYLATVKFSPITKRDKEIVKQIEAVNNEWIFMNTGYTELLSDLSANPVIIKVHIDLMTQSVQRVKQEREKLQEMLTEDGIEDIMS